MNGLINERINDGKELLELEIPAREARLIWRKF